jgi:superfamily I DNA and RNA helicase
MNETWWVDPSQLDDDQKQVVALPPDRDHLITGPPGSGKTNLLLLKATEIVRMGKPNVLILVFTRTLREFVASGVSHYAFGAEKIKTFAGWTSQFLREEGVEPETDANFEAQRKKQVRQLTEVVSRRKHGQLWDAMFTTKGRIVSPKRSNCSGVWQKS